MRVRLYSDASLCTECRMCQLACSFTKTGKFNPRLALLRIEVKNEGLISDPIVCRQCSNALCMKACVIDAMHRDDSGIVVIDANKCIGCGRCVNACAYTVIVLRDKKAMKCDLCNGSPKCIEACSTKALHLVEEVCK